MAKCQPLDFDKTLTQQGKPESLLACPRSWPEAKLIAPALLPAKQLTDDQVVGRAENGNEGLFRFL